jgi:hypothetical protein
MSAQKAQVITIPMRESVSAQNRLAAAKEAHKQFYGKSKKIGDPYLLNAELQAAKRDAEIEVQKLRATFKLLEN